MDKENTSVRAYLAKRADLVGAIRLPNNAFKSNAGTKVTSDIIILQKRAEQTDILPNWVDLARNEDGILMNRYFVDNPNMIIGKMQTVSSRFGMSTACVLKDESQMEQLLEKAVKNINATISVIPTMDIEESNNEIKILPEDANVRNYSYTIINGDVYYKMNNEMIHQNLTSKNKDRIIELIKIRQSVRALIKLQTDDFPEDDIKQERENLNNIYDKFITKYGLITSKENSKVFREDSSYYLLCSLEKVNEKGELIKKADMFYKRTIKPHKVVTKVNTSNEALILSISEKAKVDLEYMEKLTGKEKETIIRELKGEIFKVPLTENEYQTND